MSLRKEVPGRMPISAENDDCPPLGKRASSPGSERAAEAKKLRQHETPEVTVLEFEQELAVQEYEQRLAMEHEQRLAVLEYEQRLEDRVQQQQRLEDRLQQQQQRLDVLENALAKMSERMECSICHEIMHEPTTLVPCLHSFCSACVKKRRNPLCPVCRGRVENESCNIHLADIIEHFLEAHPDRCSAARVAALLERDLLATLDESTKKAVGKVVTDLVHGSVTQVKFEDNMLKGPNALQAANAVARGIAHCSSLQSLTLREEANIGSDCLEVIVTKGVVASSSLSVLGLSGIHMTDAAAFAVAQALSENLKVTGLTLMGMTISYAAGGKLAEAIKTNSTLQKLDLSYNKIRDETASLLATSLTFNSALRILNLDSARITYVGAKALASALMTNSTLQKLDLSSNEIEDEGAESLAEALESNSTLQDLYLANNQIGNVGAEALGKAMAKDHCALQDVNLSFNEIGDQGAQTLCKAIGKNHCALRELSLQGNRIGNVGAEALGEAMANDSCALRELVLADNKIGSVNTCLSPLVRASVRGIWSSYTQI